MKSNLLASAAFLLGTATTACSAPQHAAPEDRAQCSMAIDYFDGTVRDIEQVVYGEIISEPVKMRRDLQKRLLDASSILKRDCAHIPDGDKVIENQVAPITARIQRMQMYLEQRKRQKPSNQGSNIYL